MSKEKEYQNGLYKKLKPVQRVGTIALATTIAFSVPAVSNVVSEVTPFKQLEVSVAHAQSENLMDVQETLTQFHVNHNDGREHWAHRFNNSGDIPVDSPDFDISNLTYVVKFPESLSHLLEDEYVLDYLLGNITNFGAALDPFMVTGTVVDENGEEISINKSNHEPYKYISINRETNSIEFDFNSFYTENNLEPYFRQNVNGEYFFNSLGFQTPINVPDSRMLDNGTYEFKTAIVQGESVDLDQVSNAYSENLVVDYSTDPEPEVDTSTLEALVDDAKEYDADDYTEDTFVSLTSALEAAEAVLADDDVTQGEIDEASLALRSAIDGLEEVEEPSPDPEPEVDRSDLEALVDEVQSYDADNYTEESFATLTSAIEAAESVLANEDATQDEIDEALSALASAVEGLEEVEEEPSPEPEPEVDTEDLEALVDEVQSYDADNYTEESFATLTSAIEAAESVLANEDATQDEVDEALSALTSAVEGLEEVKEEPTPEPEPEVDTEDLEALVDEAQTYDATDYTEESFATLTSAIEAAESVLANEDATQDEVDEALSALASAVEGLEEVEEEPTPEPEPQPDPEPTPDPEVDTEALQSLAEQAKSYDADNYTEDSFAALTEALESANNVLNDEDATEDEVNKATESLQAAIDNLVEKESEIIVEEVEDEETDVTVEGDEEENRLPDTATNNYASMLVGSLLAIFGGAALFIRRKVFREDI